MPARYVCPTSLEIRESISDARARQGGLKMIFELTRPYSRSSSKRLQRPASIRTERTPTIIKKETILLVQTTAHLDNLLDFLTKPSKASGLQNVIHPPPLRSGGGGRTKRGRAKSAGKMESPGVIIVKIFVLHRHMLVKRQPGAKSADSWDARDHSQPRLKGKENIPASVRQPPLISYRRSSSPVLGSERPSQGDPCNRR